MRNLAKNLFLAFILFTTACSGSSSSTGTFDDFAGLPNFSISGSENLENYVENTFTAEGIDILIEPEYIDFNQDGDIDLGDKLEYDFTIKNNSGDTRTFKFDMYAVSSGFAILNEFGTNLGVWSDIEIASGSSQTFTIQFSAGSYGTQTSYLTLTSDVEGYITFPFRAKVTGGGADLRVVATGYSCSDEDVSEISKLDFYKIPTGNVYTHGLKICNIGGDDIKVYSASFSNGTQDEESAYFEIGGLEGFDVYTVAEIDENFGLNLEPFFNSTFTEPTELSPGTAVLSPSSDYSISEYSTGSSVNNLVVGAGDYVRFDVDFEPSLEIEASEGTKYTALPVNAILTLDTSLGPIEIDLYGATAGREALLEMSYRFSEDETYREIDTFSNVAALDFGEVAVFLDSIPNNEKIAEIKIENTGTAAAPLKFYPSDLVGYFEYYTEDGSNPEFPIELGTNESQTLKIAYKPTPATKEDETHWDVGQLKFQHNGSNGPNGQLTFIADQSAGYAVDVNLSGSSLKKEYSETESKNICVVQIAGQGNDATEKTFNVINNDPDHTLTVSWNFSSTEGSFSATPSSGELTILPSESDSITIALEANASETDGANLEGVMTITNTLVDEAGNDISTEYSSYLVDKEPLDYAIKLKAQASSTGECEMTPELFNDDDGDGLVQITMIRDRTTMAMLDLTEGNRDLPAASSHLPLEIDLNNMTVRIAKALPIPVSEEDFENEQEIFRAYSHFFTNPKGCSTLPSTPYGWEHKPGGWLDPDSVQCGEVTSADGEFKVHMSQLNLADKGPHEYTDSDDVTWRVYSHHFGKVDLDTCKVAYYGRVANTAINLTEDQSLEDLMEYLHEDPYQDDETYYENILGAFKHESYIRFEKNNFQCGSKTYNAGDEITDPDEIKECYLYLASLDSSTRVNGRLDQASYFHFEVAEGDTECDLENPDSCSGIGPIEKYIDADGKVHENYYNLTMYNASLNAYVLTAGDRTSFLRHPSHNIYTKFYVTFTTHILADENDPNGDYKSLIASETREHIDKNLIFLKDGEVKDIADFWTEGPTSELSNALDLESVPEKGLDYSGVGKGAFHKCSNPSVCDIIPRGWPLNTEENNLIVWNGMGAFNKTGNVLPGFAKASGSKGKPLYFFMEGCLVPGHDIDQSRGCFAYKRDDAVMPDGSLVIDAYNDRDMLPEGYPEDPAECGTFIDQGYTDPEHENYDPHKYLTCVNYRIQDIDRDRYTNYYNKANPFVLDTNFYGASYCGYGM